MEHSERNQGVYNPEFDQYMDETMAASLDNLRIWLENQMGRSGAPAHNTAEGLLGMLKDFRENPAVFKQLERLTEAGGRRETIFRSLHSAQSEMVDDPTFKEKYPNNAKRSEQAHLLVDGLIDEWPIVETRFDKPEARRITHTEYDNWLNENAA